jgi:exodeoxyribonuclease V alpha subunit
MVTRNDRMLGVANGEVGVVMPGDGQHLHLPSGNGARPPIRLELLPATELAFASTVHKSQGSEFADAALVMPPDASSPLLTREILYTGITRTKNRILLYAGDDSVRRCCERHMARVTGLGDASFWMPSRHIMPSGRH